MLHTYEITLVVYDVILPETATLRTAVGLSIKSLAKKHRITATATDSLAGTYIERATKLYVKYYEFLTCVVTQEAMSTKWIDVHMFAEWGVDLLKYDFCFHSSIIAADILYKRMGLALANCGRDILYSACSWGVADTRTWIAETGASMWRSTDDLHDTWEYLKDLSLRRIKPLEFGSTVIIVYSGNLHGCDLNNCIHVLVSHDDLLLNWERTSEFPTVYTLKENGERN